MVIINIDKQESKWHNDFQYFGMDNITELWLTKYIFVEILAPAEQLCIRTPLIKLWQCTEGYVAVLVAYLCMVKYVFPSIVCNAIQTVSACLFVTLCIYLYYAPTYIVFRGFFIKKIEKREIHNSTYKSIAQFLFICNNRYLLFLMENGENNFSGNNGKNLTTATTYLYAVFLYYLYMI